MRGRKLKPLERQIAEGDPRKRGVHKLEENWKEQLEIMNLDYGAYALGLSAGSMAFQGLAKPIRPKLASWQEKVVTQIFGQYGRWGSAADPRRRIPLVYIPMRIWQLMSPHLHPL